jgi:hypothetical protein
MGSLLVATEALLNFDLLKIQINPEALSTYLVQQAKSLVFVIGDFYQSIDYSMIAHKNQINAILVRDPLEELPLFGTELSLKNAQNNVVDGLVKITNHKNQ